MNICKAIDCPFYSDESIGYGCHRYSVSNHCHLLQKFYGLKPNRRVLSGDKTDAELQMIKRTNNDFFADDEYYKDKVEFQKTHKDWLSRDAFRVKEITKN